MKMTLIFNFGNSASLALVFTTESRYVGCLALLQRGHSLLLLHSCCQRDDSRSCPSEETGVFMVGLKGNINQLTLKTKVL